MNRLTILIFFCSSVAFGQETTPGLRPGIQVSSVFSDNYDHGITPALTLNYRRWMFSVGPRFSYDRMTQEKTAFYKKKKQLIVDAALRYYLLPDTKRVRPFAQLAISYKYTHIIFEQDYRDGMAHPYGKIYDYDFLGEWSHQRSKVSICGGIGVEVKIWKQLSVFASAGAGTSLSHGKSELKNVGTGAVEDFYRTQNKGGFSWIASAGLAYNF